MITTTSTTTIPATTTAKQNPISNTMITSTATPKAVPTITTSEPGGSAPTGKSPDVGDQTPSQGSALDYTQTYSSSTPRSAQELESLKDDISSQFDRRKSCFVLK